MILHFLFVVFYYQLLLTVIGSVIVPTGGITGVCDVTTSMNGPCRLWLQHKHVVLDIQFNVCD